MFNTYVEIDGDSYDTISHCLIRKKAIPDENRYCDDDDDNDEDEEEEEEDDDGLKKGYFSLIDLLKLFQECGANLRELNIDDAHGIPLLGVAVQEGCISLVKYLLSIGVNIHECGGIDDGNDPMYVTPLSLAVLRGSKNMVKYLIKHGADVNDSRSSDTHALLFACQHTIHLTDGVSSFSEEILLMLLEAGADVEMYKQSHYFNEEYIFPQAIPLLGLGGNKKRKKN